MRFEESLKEADIDSEKKEGSSEAEPNFSEEYESDNTQNASSDESLTIDDNVEDENQRSMGEIEEEGTSGEDH